LSKTQDTKRRTDLLAKFEEVNPEVGLASSFAWGVEGAGWNQACWNDRSGEFERMRGRLQELDRQSKKKNNFLNRERDILIAETAIKNGATLVSGDHNLRQVVSESGGCAITFPPLPGGLTQIKD
jgi:hypothetical protein